MRPALEYVSLSGPGDKVREHLELHRNLVRHQEHIIKVHEVALVASVHSSA